MTTLYNDIFLSKALQNMYTQIGIFCLKRYYLATRLCRLLSGQPSRSSSPHSSYNKADVVR
jgi:hypothetical protein